jgi:hypothetical protein
MNKTIKLDRYKTKYYEDKISDRIITHTPHFRLHIIQQTGHSGDSFRKLFKAEREIIFMGNKEELRDGGGEGHRFAYDITDLAEHRMGSSAYHHIPPGK